MGQGQGIDLRPHTLLVLSEEGVEGQVLERHCFMLGLAAGQLGGVQTQGALVQGQATALQPQLAASLQAL